MPEVTIDKARLYFQDHGDKSAFPLVLAHGLGGDHTIWLGQVPALTEKYRVVLWDCRGHGRSEVPEDGYAIERFVDDQRDIMRHLGIERAHIGGLSMGGWIAWSFALKYPEATASLLLNDSAGYLVDTTPEFLKEKRELFEVSAKIALDRGRTPIADFSVEMMFSEAFIKENPDAVAAVKKQISDDPGIGYARTIFQMFASYWETPAEEVGKKLADIKTHTQIIAGDLDTLTPLPTQQALAKAIPGARLHVVKGSGHVPPIEKPEEWARVAMEFLESVDVS